MSRALVALAAAAVLSGCGAQATDDAPSLDEIAAATRSDPYRFELTMRSEGLADQFTAGATGAADPVGKRGFVRYEFDEGDDAITTEVRQIGGDTYTRIAAADDPRGWTKGTTDEAEVISGPFGALTEPHQAVDALARHGRDVAAGPGEPIGGIATTEYRSTVSTVEIFGAGLSREARRELEKEIAESGSESANVEATVGADGVLRKLEIGVPVTEDGRSGRITISVTFFDFGEPVAIEAPPASDVSEHGLLMDGQNQPCTSAAAPHSAEAVVDALRDGGYVASGTCDDDETVVFAFPEREDGDDDNDAVMCFVSPSAERVESREGLVVEGNVACAAEPSQRAAVTAILERL